MVTILVAGCAGFIGSHVCALLPGKGFGVIGVDNVGPFYDRPAKELHPAKFKTHPAFVFYEMDITSGLDTIKETAFKAIIHLAAKAGVGHLLQTRLVT